MSAAEERVQVEFARSPRTSILSRRECVYSSLPFREGDGGSGKNKSVEECDESELHIYIFLVINDTKKIDAL